MNERELTFNESEIQVFTTFSESNSYKFWINMGKYDSEIDGLFYEIENVIGTWEFRDRVLSGLLSEMNSLLINFRTLIRAYEPLLDRYIKEIGYGSGILSEPEIKNRKRILNAMGYLIHQFEDELISNTEKLSHRFTHKSWERFIRRIRVRIMNMVEKIKNYSRLIVQHSANLGFRRLIHTKIMKRGLLPHILPYNKVFESFFPSSFRAQEKKIMTCFYPPYSNLEYHLGLKSIWQFLKVYVYFFDLDLLEEKKERSGIVLITDKLVDWDINLYVSCTIRDLFADVKKSTEFKKWFDKKRVQEKIITHCVFPIIYHFLEGEITPAESTNELFQVLDRLEKHYGFEMDFDTVSINAIEQKKDIISRCGSYKMKEVEDLHAKLDSIFPEPSGF